ncbi:hypothetical protein MVEN_00131400 [Mycena venus]|uniref:Uncharacterized protein n=1 Tax=Mycena venus TaxID=2733690 RepID=A0A8H6ZAD8_9AGAR|nr:hypothetical protein MVEN_00131400 [Mycena venus]
MKAQFDALWSEAKKTLAASNRLSMCQDYVNSCWEKESEEFKEELIKEADGEHAEAMRKYKEKREIPERTAESCRDALQTLDDVAIPLADALAERLGMHVVIMAVGPVGDQKGEVRLRSVFSDTSAGATAKIWPQFDHAGFSAAEASIVRWGRAFFTKDECRARAWPRTNSGDLAGLDDIIPLDESERANGRAENKGPITTTAGSRSASSSMPTSITHAAGSTATAIATAASRASPPAPTPCPTPAEQKLINQWSWSKTLRDLYDLMIEKAWGPRFKELIHALVAFEESTLWDESPPLPSAHRPEEIATWMKEHRKAGDFSKLKPNFGERLLTWWRKIGPESRRGPKPIDWPEDEIWPPRSLTGSDTDELEAFRRTGNNGMVLIVQALTWWGQSIVNEGSADGLGQGEEALHSNTPWQYMLEDVLWMLKELTREVDETTRAEMELAKKEYVERLLARSNSENGSVDGERAGKPKKGKPKQLSKRKRPEEAEPEEAAAPPKRRARHTVTAASERPAPENGGRALRPRAKPLTSAPAVVNGAGPEEAASASDATPTETSSLRLSQGGGEPPLSTPDAAPEGSASSQGDVRVECRAPSGRDVDAAETPESQRDVEMPEAPQNDPVPAETQPEQEVPPAPAPQESTSVEDDPFDAEMLDPYARAGVHDLTAEEAADLAAELEQDPDMGDDEGDEE